MRSSPRRVLATLIAAVTMSPIVHAHAGPPFLLVSDRPAGPYLVSVWTDPDSTDDGTAGGRFWVVLRSARGDTTLAPETRATVTVTPIDRSSPPAVGHAVPSGSDPSQQYVALVMDREGRFVVRVEIAGPLGSAGFDAEVEATYDLRPAPWLIVLYALPFLALGFLWLRLLLKRRAIRPGPDWGQIPH